MVNYALTKDRRRNLVINLMVLSSVIAVAIGNALPHLLGIFPDNFDWWQVVSPPSTLVVFGVLFYIVDNYLWRMWPLRLYLNVPYIGGMWEGTAFVENLESNKDESEIKVTVEVDQTLFRLAFVLRTKDWTSGNLAADLTSRTLSASIDNDTPVDLVFRNTYRHEDGWGTSALTFAMNDGAATLKGRYVNDRPVVGRLDLKRV